MVHFQWHNFKSPLANLRGVLIFRNFHNLYVKLNGLISLIEFLFSYINCKLNQKTNFQVQVPTNFFAS